MAHPEYEYRVSLRRPDEQAVLYSAVELFLDRTEITDSDRAVAVRILQRVMRVLGRRPSGKVRLPEVLFIPGDQTAAQLSARIAEVEDQLADKQALAEIDRERVEILEAAVERLQDLCGEAIALAEREKARADALEAVLVRRSEPAQDSSVS
jgi:hypothetical protein